MANATTAIEWTDASWNPVSGCSKVSAGCVHCYAETLSHRFGHTTAPWTHPFAAENVKLHPERLDQPLHWKKPRRIFVNSMSDLFHELVPDVFIDQVFAIMALCPQHTFQILTKRPDRMLRYLTFPPLPLSRHEVVMHEAVMLADAENAKFWDEHGNIVARRQPWPLPNVWLGTSVEDQRAADLRIPDVLTTPAAVRFLSCEPLLGPVDLRDYIWCEHVAQSGTDDPAVWRCDACGALRREVPDPNGRCLMTDLTNGGELRFRIDMVEPGHLIDWVIVGGESGPGHRPFDPDWARAIRDDCQTAGVPFFFKQHGGLTPKAGGRLLDGRTWDEFPEAKRSMEPEMPNRQPVLLEAVRS